MEGGLKRGTEDEYGELLKGLKRVLKLGGTLRDLGLQLEKNERYFYNLFSRRGQMYLQSIQRLSKLLNVSLYSLVEALVPHAIDRHELVLLLQRENSELPPCSFLDELAPRLEALLESEAGGPASMMVGFPQLAELEELRFSDRAAAQTAVEALIASLLDWAENAPSPKPGHLYSELASSLAFWGTIQRSRGLRDLSIKAFALAFPLARHSGGFWALGSCFQRAAFVLRDLGRADIGHSFVNEALGNFGACGALVDTWKCLTDRGGMYATLGKLKESDACFNQALGVLPGVEWRNRVGALQGLGANARRQGFPEKARGFLAEAARECRKEDLLLGHVRWSSAVTEFHLKHPDESLRQFSEATKLLCSFGSAGDLALLCLDHAEVLLKLGKTNQLVPMVDDVLAWLPKLRANPILCRALSKFLDLARAARIGLKELEVTRTEVRKAVNQGELI